MEVQRQVGGNGAECAQGRPCCAQAGGGAWEQTRAPARVRAGGLRADGDPGALSGVSCAFGARRGGRPRSYLRF